MIHGTHTTDDSRHTPMHPRSFICGKKQGGKQSGVLGTGLIPTLCKLPVGYPLLFKRPVSEFTVVSLLVKY